MLVSCIERWRGSCWGITNYLTLIDEIQRWGSQPTLFVTFNYDALLENAVAACTGRTPNSIAAYLSLGPFSIFKVHGSVNWAHPISSFRRDAVPQNDDLHRFIITHAGDLDVSRKFEMVDPLKPVWAEQNGRGLLFPAIAIPVLTKQRFECPEDHLNVLIQALPKVTRLLIIGWRGLDQHFLSLIAQHLGPIEAHAVCGSVEASDQVLKRLTDVDIRIRAGRRQPWGLGFSQYVQNRAGVEFFKPSRSDP
jgi:hypothetical protein